MVVCPSQPSLSPLLRSTVHCFFGGSAQFPALPYVTLSGLTVPPHLAHEAPHALRHLLTARLSEVTLCCRYMVGRDSGTLASATQA